MGWSWSLCCNARRAEATEVMPTEESTTPVAPPRGEGAGAGGGGGGRAIGELKGIGALGIITGAAGSGGGGGGIAGTRAAAPAASGAADGGAPDAPAAADADPGAAGRGGRGRRSDARWPFGPTRPCVAAFTSAAATPCCCDPSGSVWAWGVCRGGGGGGPPELGPDEGAEGGEGSEGSEGSEGRPDLTVPPLG